MSSSLLSGMFGTPTMDQVWGDDGLVETWLRVERAIAEALCDGGWIPREALDAILEAAKPERVDLVELQERTRRSGMPIKPLVDQIAAVGGPLVERYFHWGATTQDILDTSQALRLSEALNVLQAQMKDVLGHLVRMADAYRHTAMVARTNSQDASVTTWGLQISTYASEVCRHLDRLAQLRPRATVGQFGGAVGTLASFGDSGLDLRNRVLEKLDLPVPCGAWNASQDGIVEAVQFCSWVLATLNRLANDVELMGRAALAEVGRRGPEGPSSTMPHKTNPRDANMIQTLFRLSASHAARAVDLMDQTDVRSASRRVLSWVLVPEAFRAAAAGLDRASELLTALVVHPERMLANLSHSRGYVMSEAVAFALADRIGRLPAYTLVKRTLAADSSGRPMIEVLKKAPEITEHLDPQALEAACDPRNYLGSTDRLIDEVLALARPHL